MPRLRRGVSNNSRGPRSIRRTPHAAPGVTVATNRTHTVGDAVDRAIATVGRAQVLMTRSALMLGR